MYRQLGCDLLFIEKSNHALIGLGEYTMSYLE